MLNARSRVLAAIASDLQNQVAPEKRMKYRNRGDAIAHVVAQLKPRGKTARRAARKLAVEHCKRHVKGF